MCCCAKYTDISVVSFVKKFILVYIVEDDVFVLLLTFISLEENK